MAPERIDRILSRLGYCSRGEARGWLKAGRVTAGAEALRDPSGKVMAVEVRIDGEPAELPGGVLCLLHKPAGCVCSRDEREGANVFSLVPLRWSRRNPPVVAVGRLDKDTTGALLLTDDGALVQRLTSPRHKVPKTYEAVLDGDVPGDLSAVFASGTLLLPGEPEPCLPARLEVTGPRTARLELVEGRFHQVKRMFLAHGLRVLSLHRSRFGDVALEGLEPGAWRLLDPAALGLAGEKLSFGNRT
jgi:16S rRNA pseudouridine516 synthase